MTSALALLLALTSAPFALAESVAEVSLGPASIDWHPTALGSYERWVLTVSGPDGKVLRQELASGATPTFGLFDKEGNRRPDGSYHWELRAVPQIDPAVRKQLAAARAQGTSAAVEAALRSAGKLPQEQVQSGSFSIVNGSLIGPGLVEERGPKPRTEKQMTNVTAKDQVIADDLIVQGSACIGLDCVNNESFGFDTIRLKENNTRIKFDDTSTGTGFPNHDWQLTANDSASGGANKFSIEDITASTVPVTVTGSAPTNSIFVDSTGRVGLRTSTPVLDLHIATSNTPAIRLEQNNSGGFTAQTWDIAGNEANFFVRDVTGGSRLPFRIRPGAPTSSIDINASGDVGIGTASPADRLDIQGDTAGATAGRIGTSSATGFGGWEYEDETGTVIANISHDNANNNLRVNVTNSEPLVILTNSTERIRFPAPGGNVITAANGAVLTSGGVWQDNSSRASKRDIVELSDDAALKTLRELNPVTFRYKAEPDEQYVGFIAEDLPDLVATNDHKHLNPTDVVAVLTKVVQEQQKTIEALSAKVDELEKSNKK
jgi:hypothetical protein